MRLIADFLRIAAHNLRRGGQRALVALLCIAFGVMSLVAMMTVSESLSRMLVLSPQDLFGADISMDRLSEAYILPEHVAALQEMQQAGQIERYTLAAVSSTLAFRHPDSGELHFSGTGIGIDPGNYPLVGTITVGIPGDVGLPTLLENSGDILLSRDLAQENGFAVGDPIVIANFETGTPVEGRVRGIVTDTPNHKGSKIYYNLSTAEQLAGGGRMLNTALVTSAAPSAAKARLAESGWRTFLATDLARNDESVFQMFEMTLNGAGILGLLVGGIGIANTMQVLLRRRQREVAVWETLGYRSGQMQLLFGLEAALLGAVGSLLGVGLGVLISRGLVNLFSRTTNLLVAWVIAPGPLLTAFLVGLVTAVIFAMFAIVSASQVAPLALLRNEQSGAGRLPWFRALGLLVVLAAPFTAVILLVMGSLIKAIAILLFAAAGLVALGGLMGALVWLTPRLLAPLRALPLVNMARGNIRRRGWALVFAMIALFTGVVSLALGATVTQNASRVIDETRIQFAGPTLTILAPAQQEAAARAAIEARQAGAYTTGYQTPVRAIQSQALPDEQITPLLVARADAGDYTLEGAPWGSDPAGVYTYGGSNIPVGSLVEVTLWDGATRALPVVGSYTVDFQGLRPQPGLGLLLPVALSRQVAPPATVQFFIEAPLGQVQRISSDLGAALPQTTVINLLAYATRFTQAYQNLFVLAVAMAGLALLAGILLIANSVSLAMFDRRFEIGVLKTMGYSHGHILATLVVEYSLVALIATVAGLAGVASFLWVMGQINPLAGSLLVMPAPSAALIGLAAIGLTLLTVLGVTWGPTRVSPLVVLNDRG